MCGIAGFAGPSFPEQTSSAVVRAMCDAIHHRGPDEAGYYVDDGISLGMRRLSIIDISGGSQPIWNEDKSVVVVFNGEIYNHHELRRDLERAGHSFGTASDTEVLVHLYEEHGSGMHKLLNGMFAFALWDLKRETLVVSRDRTGMKPLSYAVLREGIVFCSELRSLLNHPDFEPRVDTRSVMSYLALGYVPEPASIFEGVRKLPPGHFLEWNAENGLSVNQYWKAPTPTSENYDKQELIRELTQKLENAVGLHLESEVPLGAFLSGGLDSSTVVALMSRYAEGRVKTFSIGFEEAEYDESAAARRVSLEYQTDHTELILKPDVESTLDTIAMMFDEPFGDSSAIPTFFVAQLAREKVTVALSGDGGDELFGGYSRYSQTLGQMSVGGAAGRLLAAFGRFMPHSMPGRNKLTDIGRSPLGQYLAKVTIPVRLDEGGLARPRAAGADRYVSDHLADVVESVAGEDLATAMMLIDLQSYLPGDILTKVDRTSMAVSLEARVPLLDISLIDFAFGLDPDYRVNREQGKRLFRETISHILPDWLLHRPKQGFAIPLAEWFRGSLRHRVLDLESSTSRIAEYVDESALARTVQEHLSGRRDHSTALWRLIVLERWLRALQDGELASPPGVPSPVAA